jgi:hypothetical protein
MKVTLNTVQPVSREHSRPTAMRGNAAAKPTAPANAPLSANAADPVDDPAKPAKLADIGGQKTTPPGLERVLARLQNIPMPERTTGQSNALERVARNIARYVETQAMAAPPADTSLPTTLLDAGLDSVPAPAIDVAG